MNNFVEASERTPLKYLLSILFILNAPALWAQSCFEAIQNGQAVEVICADLPVYFRDCTPNPDPNAVIFYYPGPGKFDPQNYNQNDLLQGETSTTLTTPGSYVITQVINKQGGGGTQVFEQTFEVKGSPEPEFMVQSCSNGFVNFTITDTNYDSYTIDFGNGSTSTVTPGVNISTKYSSPGDYTVTFTGNYADAVACGGSKTTTVTALPLLDEENPTQLTKLTVLRQAATNGSVQLELSGLVPGYDYAVEQYTGDFRNPYREIGLIQNVSATTLSYTINNIDTEEGTWYLVRPVDACGSFSINSNIVSALALELSTNELQVDIAWDNLPDFEKYELFRNGTLLQTFGSEARSYIDTDVTCGQTYRYYVIGSGTDPQGDSYASVSVELETQVTSSAIPAAPLLLTSYNLNNQVEITLEGTEPDGRTSIERSINKTVYKPLATVTQPVYLDDDAGIRPICYRATFTNACGNSSALSNISCPVILTAERQTDGSVLLNWSDYVGFPTGNPEYTVELLDASGNPVTTYPATGLTFTDNTLSGELQVLRYRIKAISQDGSIQSYSNIVPVEQDALLYIPSAFTPNGDGLNDTFEIKGKFFSSYTLRVYNRMGNVIFEGTDANPAWDGTQNGQLVLPGAYAYELTITTSFGTVKNKRGTITLLR